MKFIVDNGPHIRDNDNTTKIMKRLLIALLPIIVFAIYKNGIIPYQKGYIDLFEALRPLLLIIIAVITSFVSELLFAIFVLKKAKEDLIDFIKHSYGIFPGLFLALILPINTPFWIVIIGSIFASVVGKMLFGGLGYNIFNPALVGSLFITSSYGHLIASKGGYLNGMELDTITKATPLTNLQTNNFVGTWNELGSHFGSLSDFFFGFIPGSLAETGKVFILLALIYLILTKVIKWRIPIFYLLTVFIMTLIIGITNDMGLWYPLFHLLSGGLMFGAVFMATDPVTSPVTKTGQFIYGISLGILTVVFRFLTSYPEGVLTAILSMNMLVFIIDKIGVQAKINFKRSIIPITILLIIMISLTLLISNRLNTEIDINDKVNIIDIREEENNIIYNVNTDGFYGMINADLFFEDDRLIKINIIKQNESYWQKIEEENYLDKLINAQDDIENIDTVSGATSSSTALKLMVRTVLENYKKKGDD